MYLKNLFSLISGFRILVFIGFFRFRIPHFRVARQRAGDTAQTPNANEHEPPNERQANESPNPTQTEQTDGWECRKQLCYKTEKINVWSQIYRVIYLKSVLYWLYVLYTRWSYLASRTWYATQFHNIIVAPTIEYRRSKIKVLHTTLRSSGKRGHIVARNVSWAAQTEKHLLTTQNVSEQNQKHFCVPDTKFVSATNVARSGKQGNICVGNNLSATMCPRLPGP